MFFVILDVKKEKEISRKHELSAYNSYDGITGMMTPHENLLLVQGKVDSHGDGDGCAYHGVVTDAEEAHHLHVSGN